MHQADYYVINKSIWSLAHLVDNLRFEEHHLHSANFIQKSDVIRGAERGVVYGLSVGIFFFVIALLGAPFWDVMLSVRQMILLMLFSSPIMLGFFIGAFIGTLKSNFRITQFRNEIAIGHHLMLVDAENINACNKLLAQCPVVDVGETETVVFPFDELEVEWQQAA